VVLEEHAGVEMGEVGWSAKENITLWSLLQMRIYTSTLVFAVFAAVVILNFRGTCCFLYC